jgi:CRISPR/Cas system endoribonuclease Cas6 (RAMP superfamily)
MRYKSRRYSGRQKQDIRIDGILGSIIDGSAMKCFSEWITLGSYIGCGKGTTIGYGEYKVS